MFTFFLVIYGLISIFLIFIVLLQVGRGAEMGAAFGSMSQGQLPHTPENFLGKITTYVAIVFMLFSFGLAYFSSSRTTESVLDDVLDQTQVDYNQDTNANEVPSVQDLPANEDEIQSNPSVQDATP